VRLKPILLTGVVFAFLSGLSPVSAQTNTTTPPSATTPSTMGTPRMAPARPGMAAPTNATMPKGAPININTASSADLDSLPQIGPKRAAKIIANRPYKSIDELVTKKAIPKSVFEKIKDRITA
jgi:competence protein ComEA